MYLNLLSAAPFCTRGAYFIGQIFTLHALHSPQGICISSFTYQQFKCHFTKHQTELDYCCLWLLFSLRAGHTNCRLRQTFPAAVSLFGLITSSFTSTERTQYYWSRGYSSPACMSSPIAAPSLMRGSTPLGMSYFSNTGFTEDVCISRSSGLIICSYESFQGTLYSPSCTGIRAA